MLVLVRHGRTEANAAGLLLGRADPPLDELGRAQAQALGAALGDIDLVVTSPLRRARETAAALRGPVRVDDRWIELDYGRWEGHPVDGVPAQTWDRWRRDPDFAPPGGESLRALGRRVRPACEELAGAAATGTVVVVTHVSPLKAAVAWSLGVGDEIAWRVTVDTASITRIELRAGVPALRGFNEVGHLA